MAARLQDHYDVLFIGNDGNVTFHSLLYLTSVLLASFVVHHLIFCKFDGPELIM